MIMYDVYGKIVTEISDATLVAGRANTQKFAEPFIIQDIIAKLELNSTDHVLEIGCAMGTLLFPLSFVVNKMYGIDHPNIVGKLKEIPSQNQCEFHGGNWLTDTFDLPSNINKIIIYSVLQYMRSFEELMVFTNKALNSIPSGGKILIGDIPNSDRRRFFNASPRGKQFHEAWEKTRHESKTDEEKRRDEIFKDNKVEGLIDFNDDLIFEFMRTLRKEGHEVYLLPQPNHLPFGNTREDILIIKY